MLQFAVVTRKFLISVIYVIDVIENLCIHPQGYQLKLVSFKIMSIFFYFSLLLLLFIRRMFYGTVNFLLKNVHILVVIIKGLVYFFLSSLF